jgi:hypothetical protein
MTYTFRLIAVAIAATLVLTAGVHMALSQTPSPTAKPSYSLPRKRGVSDFGRFVVLVRLGGAQTEPEPGQVPSSLGSPDPREHVQHGGYFAGLVPARLGSQDPRDTAGASLGVSLTPQR